MGLVEAFAWDAWNLNHGTSIGILVQPLGFAEPAWTRPDTFLRALADNAYSGICQPTLP